MNSQDYVVAALNTNCSEEDYKKIAERLRDPRTLKLLHAIMGMVTEAGEMMDAMKRHLIYGKPLDDINIKEECGDSFWYHALLAHTSGFTFSQAMELNIKKLASRYPEKFSEEAALNRDIVAEREILESEGEHQEVLDAISGESNDN